MQDPLFLNIPSELFDSLVCLHTGLPFTYSCLRVFAHAVPTAWNILYSLPTEIPFPLAVAEGLTGLSSPSLPELRG